MRLFLEDIRFMALPTRNFYFRRRVRAVPAQAVLDQFDQARRECTGPAKLSAWFPTLGQYGPGLLARSALDMSRELVRTWLAAYMFKDKSDRSRRAKKVSNWLSGHGNFKSRSGRIPRTEFEKHGLAVFRLESDEQFQDLSVFHATMHTFTDTRAVKIVENHTGRAFSMPFIPFRPFNSESLRYLQTRLTKRRVPVCRRRRGHGRSPAATLGDWTIRCAFQNRLISRRTLSMNLVTDGACRFCNP